MGAIATSGDRVQEVVSTLEEDIVLGRLYPRERLVEDHLSQRFQISRHIVRQVLAELEQAGLILRASGRGVVVAEYSIDEVNELYQMRDLLEGQAARLIPLPLTGPALTEIEALAQAYADAVATMDMQAVIRANKAFHQKIFAQCGNRFLSASIDQMAQRANLVRFSTSTNPAFLARSRDEHFQIIEALKQSDHDRLAALCVQHLQPSREYYIELHRRRV